MSATKYLVGLNMPIMHVPKAFPWAAIATYASFFFLSDLWRTSFQSEFLDISRRNGAATLSEGSAVGMGECRFSAAHSEARCDTPPALILQDHTLSTELANPSTGHGLYASDDGYIPTGRYAVQPDREPDPMTFPHPPPLSPTTPRSSLQSTIPNPLPASTNQPEYAWVPQRNTR